MEYNLTGVWRFLQLFKQLSFAIVFLPKFGKRTLVNETQLALILHTAVPNQTDLWSTSCCLNNRWLRLICILLIPLVILLAFSNSGPFRSHLGFLVFPFFSLSAFLLTSGSRFSSGGDGGSGWNCKALRPRLAIQLKRTSGCQSWWRRAIQVKYGRGFKWLIQAGQGIVTTILT